MDVGRPGKSGACWRDQAKDKGFAGRIAPTCLCPSIGKQKYRPQSERLRSAFLFSIRLLRSSLVLTRLHDSCRIAPFLPSRGNAPSAAFASFAGRHPGAAFPAPELSSLLRSSLVLTRLHSRDFLRRNSEATHIPEQLPTLLFSTR